MAKKKKKLKSTVIKLVLTVVLLVVAYLIYAFGGIGNNENPNNDTPPSCDIPRVSAEFHYIDVGQGDAILIRAGGKNVLIDTGDKDGDNALVTYLNNHKVTELEYFVITHFDADHFGESVEILQNFTVKNVLMPNQVKTTKLYENFLTALEDNPDVNVLVAREDVKIGDKINVGELEFTVLAPLSDEYSDGNDYSVVLMARWGNNKFLLTGDAEKESEEEMLAKYKGTELDCDVFKAGHHGSKTSSCQGILDKASPQYIVISCVYDGQKYRHPHRTSLDRFIASGAELYRTDLHGSVVFTTDGENITVKTEKTVTDKNQLNFSPEDNAE